MGKYSSPASLTVTDVLSWATQARLGPTTIAALEQNEVDGPTLVTLTKTELQTELGISSLSARRYLWDLIKGLRLEQDANDYSVALRAHEEEIQTLALSGSGSSGTLVASPDEASGGIHNNPYDPSLSTMLSELTLDAQRQRQIMSDHMFARKLQRAMKSGQEI